MVISSYLHMEMTNSVEDNPLVMTNIAIENGDFM